MAKQNQKPAPSPTPPTSASGVLGAITTDEAERLKLPAEPPLDSKPPELRTPLPDGGEAEKIQGVDAAGTPVEVDAEDLVCVDIAALAKGIKVLFEATGHPMPRDIRESIEAMAAGKFCPVK